MSCVWLLDRSSVASLGLVTSLTIRCGTSSCTDSQYPDVSPSGYLPFFGVAFSVYCSHILMGTLLSYFGLQWPPISALAVHGDLLSPLPALAPCNTGFS